ncbi:hypothetical protein D3C83_44580 [compost metagenome]
MLVADEIDAATPDAAAAPACDERSTKRGRATAARMPRITITTTSSIKVKPFCICFMLFLHLLTS